MEKLRWSQIVTNSNRGPQTATTSRRRNTMGVCIYFQAIPPQSSLYARCQVEPAFKTLMISLFYCGNGILRFFEMDVDEVEWNFQDAIARYPNTLGSEAQAK